MDPAQVSGFTGLGWTWIDLYAKELDQLRSGSWSLPIYSGPTRPAVAQGKGRRPSFAPGVTLSVRLGHPGDSVFRGQALNYINLERAPIPKEHMGAAE